MKTVILCEGGPMLGMGHVVRMDRLAQTRVATVTFVVRQTEPPANSHYGAQWLRERGYAVIEVSKADAQAVVVALAPERIIVDTYDWYGYDFAVMANVAPIIFWDDQAHIQGIQLGFISEQLAAFPAHARQRMHVIQPGVFAERQTDAYVNVTRGFAYCLLATEYHQALPQAPKPHLLVSFGSSDPHDVSAQVASVFVQAKIPTTIVIGPAFHRPVEEYRTQFPSEYVRFHEPVPSLVPLLEQATHVLCSASTTVYEVLACKRQLATITTVDNQRGIASALAAADIGTHFGWYADLSEAALLRGCETFWQQQPQHVPDLQAGNALERCWDVIATIGQ